LNEAISGMIFSEKFGQKSFNIDVPERIACLDAFPVDRIDENVLPLFLDWLRELVVLVEIVAYSDEHASTIFETMNDRGLNLTPTKMLKGFLLSKYRNYTKRKHANDFWKKTIVDLKAFDKLG